VLTLARALAKDAAVTVVFRRVLADVRGEPFAVMGLETRRGAASAQVAPSRRALGRFVEQRAEAFGVVLEGSWSLPGKLTAWCDQRGIPAIPILDRVPPSSWLAPFDPGRAWLGLGAAGRYLRRAPLIVAGSQELRAEIVGRWRVQRERVTIIGPAIDRTLFAPRDQGEARRRLGLSPDHRVVVATGGLDRGADITPLVGAVARAGDPALRLHVIGDGERREALERLAGKREAVTFHRAVSDKLLASWLAAADLCVSVEDDGDPAFSVHECLSAGRPVVVGATGDGTAHPVCPQVSGFVVEHELLSWIRFLQRDCPSRNTLRMMGMAAAVTPIAPVEATAAAYLQAIDRVRHQHLPSAVVV
jgi:glycosyltransferase involved in cell wall biosynthesis